MVHTEQQQEPTSQHANVGKRILRATGALVIIQTILKGFGFFEKMILAKVSGTELGADAYNAAKDIAFYVFQLVDQVTMHSFLPVFVERMRERGERDAWRLASTAINLLILIMVPLVVLGIIFAPEVLPFFQPDWFKTEEVAKNAEKIGLTVQLMRMMLAAIVFLATSSLTYCLLNSYKQFALPHSAELALKGAVLVFAAIFAAKWGPIAFVVGFMVGAVAKLAVHSIGFGARFRNYQPAINLRDEGFRKFGLLALPLLAGVGFSIFRQIMDNRFLSGMVEGSLSAVKYARTLTDMPVAIFPFVFGIALFPFLADIAQAGDKERLRNMLMMATRLMILIFIPLAIGMIVLRYPILLSIFGSEKFTQSSASLTAAPLNFYALGMLIGALEIIVLQFFFAMSDTLRPTIIGMVMVPIHITVAWIGIHFWGLEAAAIALALLCSKGVKVTVLYYMIRKKLVSLEGERMLGFLGKFVLALVPFVVILAVGAYFTPILLPPPGEVDGKLMKLIALIPYVVVGGVGGLIYLAMLHLLKVEEVGMMLKKVREKLLRKPAAV